jgi:hypothetical protein
MTPYRLPTKKRQAPPVQAVKLHSSPVKNTPHFASKYPDLSPKSPKNAQNCEKIEF